MSPTDAGPDSPVTLSSDGEVLVVDDDGATRALVATWLRSAGFTCAEAGTGEEALAMLERDPSRYDAVVLDLMMPGMDGFEVLRRIQATPSLRRVQVLFLTASASEADIIRGAEAGAAEYLLKPFSGPVLVAKLKAVRERARAEWMLRRRLQSAEQNATTDSLTELLNRRSFDERSSELIGFAARHREALTLLMLDVDRFKRVNDEFGHPAGDVALRFIADSIRKALRLGDLAFRYGGEEFALLLRKCDLAGGVGVYERLREELRKRPVDVGRGESLFLTVSGGLASLEPSNEFRGADLVARADAALYAAKEKGRDRVESEPALS